MFEPQRAFDVTWLISTKKESAYGTALADANLSRRVTAARVEVGKQPKLFRSGLDRAGTGHEFATELEETARDLRRSSTFDASSLTLAWVAAFALGKVATSQPNPGGNPTAYEELTADLKRRLVPLACNDFALTGRAREPVELRAAWIGSGATSDGAYAGSLPPPPPPSFLFLPPP